MSGEPELRIGDSEREAAASALGEHFASGRLTREEYDERSEQVWSAKVNSDLWPLFADLPAPQMTRQRPPTSRSGASGVSRRSWRDDAHGASSGRRHRGLPFLPVMLIAIALVIALPGPPWPLFVLGGMWFAGCFGRWSTPGWVGHRRR